MGNRECLVAVVGPTGVGKTRLGVELAESFHGEIISADSMAVYRGMDIGTDKPGLDARSRVRHHLLDIVDPDREFSVGEFKSLARRAIAQIGDRGHLPILVGGTALYIRTLLYDYPLASVGSRPALRKALENEERRCGRGTLHRRLAVIDPESAERLHPNDLRRIIRALEVHRITGTTMTQWRNQTPSKPVYPCLLIGLWLPREDIYRRIDARVDRMFTDGLVEEVRELLQFYPRLSATASQALGYREVLSYLGGSIDFEECLRLVKRNTRHFAKRQLSWFRREPGIHWICGESPTRSARELVIDWLERC